MREPRPYIIFSDEMYDYEKSCSSENPIEEQVSIEFRDVGELIELADYLRTMIWQTSQEFGNHKEAQRSSSAESAAVANRLLTTLMLKLRHAYEKHDQKPDMQLFSTNDDMMMRAKERYAPF